MGKATANSNTNHKRTRSITTATHTGGPQHDIDQQHYRAPTEQVPGPGSQQFTEAYRKIITRQGAAHKDIVKEIGRLEARVCILVDPVRGIAVPSREWYESKGYLPQVPIPPATTDSANNRQSEAESKGQAGNKRLR